MFTSRFPRNGTTLLVAVALSPIGLSLLAKTNAAETNAVATKRNLQVQIVADEMCCNGCARKIAAQLYAAPGVTSVEADVPTRTLTITAKASPKLTLAKLWSAVEKGKGVPSKLVASDATYVLKNSANLKPEQRSAGNRYSLTVHTMTTREGAQQIANRLYGIRGVKSVSVDLAKRTLYVSPAETVVLSPWRLAAAVERAEHQPTAVLGPHGLLTIKRAAKAEAETAARNQSAHQGEIR